MDEVSGVPLWRDVNPRLGASYDIFGTGRTALKISLGRYLELSRSDFTRNFHPFTSSVNAATRGWSDADGDFEVDGDQANFAANGELGPISNSNFGQFRADFVDDGTVRGLSNELFHYDIIEGNRTYLWDFLTEVQHELFDGFSVAFGYNRNWAGAFRVEDNTLLEPGDFDEYCVAVPNDPLFGSRAGTQQCGFYDVTPEKFSLVNNLNTTASTYGDHKKEWDGFVFSLDGRFPNGATLAGGLDIGKQLFDFCYTIDRPNQPREMNSDFYGTSRNDAQYSSEFCNYERSWGDLTDFRIRGSYPLPANFNVAWTWRDSPGQAVNARLGLTNDLVTFVDPTRTAALTRARGNRSVQINPLLQSFTERHRQLDVRFTRRFDLQGLRFDTSIDLYNALNANPTLSLNGAVGGRFLQPTSVLDGRLLQLYAQLSF